MEKLREELAGKEIYVISGVSKKGVEELLDRLWKILSEEKENAAVA